MENFNPPEWPRPSGYANGVAAQGRTLFVAGQVGWNPVTRMVETDDFAAQVKLALVHVAAVLRAGGATPSQVTRLTWYITDKGAYLSSLSAIGAAYREVFGRHFPTMSVVVVAGLIEDRAKVEIEATAVVEGSPGPDSRRIPPG